MAIIKNALIRYKILDKCFRNQGRKYYIDDLISECNKALENFDSKSKGISLRQVRDDIAFMKSSEGWDVELGDFRDGKKMYYRYVDTSFSINNMPLNDIEIEQLKSTISILSQFNGMPQFEWMNELLPKLKQGLDSNEQSKTIITFDNNQYLKGIDLLGPLHNAILYKKVLSIDYQPFEEDRSVTLILHPHFLKQYNNRWFLFGLNPETEKPDWNLALDRIVSIKDTTDIYQISQINWTEYFEDIIGVTKSIDKSTEIVVLHFYGKTGMYMTTKPIHGSQKSKWINENTLEVTLDIIINYELERLILSYADSAKVILPFAFAETIKNRLYNGSKNY